jgi:hypothetical protein
MTIKTDSYIIGSNADDTRNFLLDTDLAGALRIRRKSDGSGGLLATINANGALVMATPQSMVRLDGANGFGSTNTAIKRYTNVRLNQGSDITYADSATLGASFTINTAGVYAIMVSSNNAGTSYPGISLNTTQPSTSIIALTNASERLAVSSGSGGNMGEAVWIGYLLAGSVVRPHTDIAASSGPASEYCTITKVG